MSGFPFLCGNPADRFDMAALRAAAAEEVKNSPLIRLAAEGDRFAAIALHRGFWEFVREFEVAIDRQDYRRETLEAKFGGAKVRKSLVSIFRTIRAMREEEASHANHWKQDAKGLGIDYLEGPIVHPVKKLVESAYTENLPRFFAVLAGTEFIAEELSRMLVASEPFTSLFEQKRWTWGEIHLLPHHHGPSHLEIDLDLARAYHVGEEIEAQADINRHILETIHLFGEASRHVKETYIA